MRSAVLFLWRAYRPFDLTHTRLRLASLPRYRVNDPTFRTKRWGNTFVDGFEQLKRHIWRKHPTLDKAFPVMKPKRNIQLEPVAWEPPFEQALARTDKQIMFILPWLYMGGADIGESHFDGIEAASPSWHTRLSLSSLVAFLQVHCT